jgi:5-methylcytosine-specific restriction endonuclease McrA
VIEYSFFLNSPFWAEQKEEVKKRDGYRCRRCGEKRKHLTVHHLSYFNLLDADLCVTLCHDCHDLIHGFSKYDPLKNPLENIGQRHYIKEEVES